MKIINKILVLGFYFVNLVLITLYLYPGSILGYFFYKNIHMQPQITRDFIISSNHFYAFIILSTLGVFAYRDKKKIGYLIIYLFLLSIILEALHIIIPSRMFQWSDFFGNILGIIFVIIIYKVKIKYV